MSLATWAGENPATGLVLAVLTLGVLVAVVTLGRAGGR